MPPEMIEQMTQIMAKMMPYMWTIADVGIGLLALGIFAWLVWIFGGWGTGLLRLSGRLLVVFGLFFLACQAAGLLLGMKPWLNLGDVSKAEFESLPFWIVGLAFLVPGLIFRIFGAFRPTH